MPRATFSPYIGKRAQQVRPGQCLICACTDLFGCPSGCAWEPGTNERLCTAHTDAEKLQARNALRAADRARKEKVRA